jgi:hypothetical protein
MRRNKKYTFTTTLTDRQFGERIQELLDRAQRLKEMEAQGYRYAKVRVKEARVKAHTRRAYWSMRPVKRK